VLDKTDRKIAHLRKREHGFGELLRIGKVKQRGLVEIAGLAERLNQRARPGEIRRAFPGPGLQLARRPRDGLEPPPARRRPAGASRASANFPSVGSIASSQILLDEAHLTISMFKIALKRGLRGVARIGLAASVDPPALRLDLRC
jgi:hypothetical protein